MVQRLNRHASTRATAAVVAVLTSVSLVFAQTKIVAPENKYQVEEDVKYGREAARMSSSSSRFFVTSVDAYVGGSVHGGRKHHLIPASAVPVRIRLVHVGTERCSPGPDVHQSRQLQAARKSEVAGVLAHEIITCFASRAPHRGKRLLSSGLDSGTYRRRDSRGVAGQASSIFVRWFLELSS